MNFLAHLFLAGNDENLIVGNFLADFITNKEVSKLPHPIQGGVRLHRLIDSYTDVHPSVRNSVKRLRPVHRKYAPVILDVLYDFVLAKNWGTYSRTDLSEFTASSYEILSRYLYLMPPYLQERLPLMIADDWLLHYGTEKGLRFTFSRMKLRSKHPRFFDQAFDSFMKDYGLYETDFNVFFPDAITYVSSIETESLNN